MRPLAAIHWFLKLVRTNPPARAKKQDLLPRPEISVNDSPVLTSFAARRFLKLLCRHALNIFQSFPIPFQDLWKYLYYFDETLISYEIFQFSHGLILPNF